MGRKVPIFYNALLLTGVNLLLRLVSTAFQVFLSGRMGAAGVGLLQLVLSVASMAMTAGMAGIRTATMYLTAEELGKDRTQNVPWVLTGCMRYSLLFSGLVGAAVYLFAPWIAEAWIGDLRTLGAIRLFGAFLPVNCMVGVMVGYYTAANRIATLAAVEVAEQACSMAVSTVALVFWAGTDPGRACQAVVLGSCAGGVLTLTCLMLLRMGRKEPAGPRIPVAARVIETALPLAVADDLKVGINTVENLMVPRRLALFTAGALAQFGMVSGMVFPLMMFPAAILYGLADLLIPEMAGCNAAGSRMRIRYLARRTLRVALLYGVACGGVLFLCADGLCSRLYGNQEAGEYLRWYALLVPILYGDLVVDAMNKGLGMQKICVRYNILTAVLDVAGLYVLLPRFGMVGYFASFTLSHGVNAALSLGLLRRSTRLHLRPMKAAVPLGAMALAIGVAGCLQPIGAKCIVFGVVLVCTLVLGGALRAEDGRWLLGLVRQQKSPEKNRNFLKKVFDKSHKSMYNT